jgi:hypothetical protein
VGQQLVYGIRAQTSMGKKEAKELAIAMRDRVGIWNPPRVL